MTKLLHKAAVVCFWIVFSGLAKGEDNSYSAAISASANQYRQNAEKLLQEIADFKKAHVEQTLEKFPILEGVDLNKDSSPMVTKFYTPKLRAIEALEASVKASMTVNDADPDLKEIVNLGPSAIKHPAQTKIYLDKQRAIAKKLKSDISQTQLEFEENKIEPWYAHHKDLLDLQAKYTAQYAHFTDSLIKLIQKNENSTQSRLLFLESNSATDPSVRKLPLIAFSSSERKNAAKEIKSYLESLPPKLLAPSPGTAVEMAKRRADSYCRSKGFQEAASFDIKPADLTKGSQFSSFEKTLLNISEDTKAVCFSDMGNCSTSRKEIDSGRTETKYQTIYLKHGIFGFDMGTEQHPYESPIMVNADVVDEKISPLVFSKIYCDGKKIDIVKSFRDIPNVNIMPAIPGLPKQNFSEPRLAGLPILGLSSYAPKPNMLNDFSEATFRENADNFCKSQGFDRAVNYKVRVAHSERETKFANFAKVLTDPTKSTVFCFADAGQCQVGAASVYNGGVQRVATHRYRNSLHSGSFSAEVPDFSAGVVVTGIKSPLVFSEIACEKNPESRSLMLEEKSSAEGQVKKVH